LASHGKEKKMPGVSSCVLNVAGVALEALRKRVIEHGETRSNEETADAARRMEAKLQTR
jgi:hypothetical protein